MTTMGTVESLWRYPVKSMRGEEMTEAFMGFSGFFGDRCFAFKNSSARKGFPYLSATAQPQMLRYRPRFRHPDRAAKPPNLAEAMSIEPGVTPANADPDDLTLDVATPSGAVVAIDDPALPGMLVEGLRGENHLTLVRSDRALTDCRPVSLISLQTIRQVEAEVGTPLDKRRFRANIYLDLAIAGGALPRRRWSAAGCASVRARRSWFWNATRAARRFRSIRTRASTTRRCFARSPRRTAPVPASIAPFWSKEC